MLQARGDGADGRMDDNLAGMMLGDDLLHTAVEIGRSQRRAGLARLAQIGEQMLGLIVIFVGDIEADIFFHLLDLLFDGRIRSVGFVDLRYLGVDQLEILAAGKARAQMGSGALSLMFTGCSGAGFDVGSGVVEFVVNGGGFFL